MIKTFKFDKNKDIYTKEVEEITLDNFIKIFVMRTYNWKINYIEKSNLQYFCDKYNIPYENNFTKEDFINKILSSTTQKEKLELCDMFQIGVTKYNYLATGMTEKEYNKIYKKLEVVGKETIRGKQFKNLYSVKQYIDYIKGGELK